MNPESSSKQALVVGSGIIGIACAHYLSRAGIRVTVIDRGRIAGACSSGNCGYICPSHVLPLTEPAALRAAIRSLCNPRAPFRVKATLRPALWNWMWQFARRCNRRQMLSAGLHLKAILDSSASEYRQLMATENLACEWRENGLLYVLKTRHGMSEFAETDRLLTEHFDTTAQRIQGADLPDLDPALRSGLAGGYHYRGDASVRPDLLNSEWSRRLQEQGVRFIEKCELLHFEKEAGRITRLQTSQGPMEADFVIVATGAWSPHLGGELNCRIPIQPGKGYSITTLRPDPCPRYPMLFPEHKVGVSPFEQGCRLGSIMEFCGYDTSLPPRRLQQLRDSAANYLKVPLPDEVQQAWYGWRPMTWDSLPIIGAAPGLANTFLATGHNMLGLSMATATGKLIAELVRGEPAHIDISAFSPARFQSSQRTS
ncbi:NAD(P)/FAD-dependent oxidoreductase [Lignipirellula cremea]|uniref:D-amino acid dehydrogenase small subunit n=1 Tax=Lignipirellula cremea TaxID=2528010 RepID=A0A518DVV4_9BACT|nr:FAD-dependent oxidoreductase [Lignipirellula cremea]QDU95964.1 D-amino acid dehydrogenase small subunit [Lignipirellula cremea]